LKNLLKGAWELKTATERLSIFRLYFLFVTCPEGSRKRLDNVSFLIHWCQNLSNMKPKILPGASAAGAKDRAREKREGKN
jgi:hypothetical protein